MPLGTGWGAILGSTVGDQPHQPHQPRTRVRARPGPPIFPVDRNYGRATVAVMAVDADKVLTPQQERFAQLVVERDNLSAAYRGAYDVSPNVGWNMVASNASETAKLPHVARRIAELRQLAAERTAIPALAERIREQRELETADPADLIAIRWVNCRYCRGEGHKFQWKDEMEFAQACDVSLSSAKPNVPVRLPDCEGGFGYHGLREPVEDCPQCWGVGVQHVRLADFTKLTGGAKRLYKGVKLKGDGSIEILMHDQQKASDMLNRIQGAYKDGVPVQAPAAATAQAAAAATPEERQRAYLRLVSA